MRRTDIDPRVSGDRVGYQQAVLVEQPRRWLFVSGHEARADDGSIAHPGDLRVQVRLTFQRLRETLGKAGFRLVPPAQGRSARAGGMARAGGRA
jgi:enamine deaminase RidA (YjgF/YER057c/UK114 family)